MASLIINIFDPQKKKRPPRELRGEQACRGNMLTPGVCWRHLEGAKAAGRQRWREGTRGAVLRGLGAGRSPRGSL